MEEIQKKVFWKTGGFSCSVFVPTNFPAPISFRGILSAVWPASLRPLGQGERGALLLLLLLPLVFCALRRGPRRPVLFVASRGNSALGWGRQCLAERRWCCESGTCCRHRCLIASSTKGHGQVRAPGPFFEHWAGSVCNGTKLQNTMKIKK